MNSKHFEISRKPAFLLWKALPFILIQSGSQFVWCLLFVGAGMLVTYLFFPREAIPFVAVGIGVGLLPTLIAALPYEICVTGLDPAAEKAWLRYVRAILARFNYEKSCGDTEGGKSETWKLSHSGWRLPWRETDMRLLIGNDVLRVQGPRSVIHKLWKRFNAAARASRG